MNQESLQLQYALQDHARDAGFRGLRPRSGSSIPTLGCKRPHQPRPGTPRLSRNSSPSSPWSGSASASAYDKSRAWPATAPTGINSSTSVATASALKLCDQDGIYDPATPNGRLILGLKGLISELEMHTLRARLTAGPLNKASRGELALGLPAGLVRDPLDRVFKHPDREAQGCLDAGLRHLPPPAPPARSSATSTTTTRCCPAATASATWPGGSADRARRPLHPQEPRLRGRLCLTDAPGPSPSFQEGSPASRCTQKVLVLPGGVEGLHPRQVPGLISVGRLLSQSRE